MTDEEAMLTLGEITTAARLKTGSDRVHVAEKMGINYRTLASLERAELKTAKGPLALTTARVEKFYGWRDGSMREFWENRRQYTFGEVTEELFHPEDPKGLAKASELTDEELMSELHFRFIMRDRRHHD
jgi:hypothetical protein